MIRTAVTLYSAACIGIFVRLIDFKKMETKKDDFFLWGIILVTYISFGWAKGLLFQAIKNRKEIRECIKRIIISYEEKEQVSSKAVKTKKRDTH